MPILQETGFSGANLKVHKRFLPDGVGTLSMNQKPAEQGDFRPWRTALALAVTSVVSNAATIYRMGRSSASPTTFWLSWSTLVHVIRGFDTSDPTERTYYTGDGVPKWTDNTIGLTPPLYPTTSRLLAVPQPTLVPGVALNADGPSGDARQLYYVFTWVNDIGWESAPSPPVLAPAAKPGAILDLTISEAVPAGNYGVNRVRWYRQEEAGDTETAPYFFLREYAVGAGGMQDDARALGEELATETWIVLPNSATWLTQCWNQFAAAIVDKSVRFCEPGIIYAWPIGYELTFGGETPLALAAFAQRLLVLTDGGAFVCTGSAPEGIDQKPMRLAVIVSQRSLVVGESFAMWAAKDGLWYYGVDGYRNLVEACMTAEQWETLVPSTIVGTLLQLGERTLYFGSYNDGTLKGFIVDPSNPNGIYFLDKGYQAAYWDPLQRELFVLDAGTLKQWDAGAGFMTGTWRGKVHRQTEYAEGEWLEILSTGQVAIKVFNEASDDDDDDDPLQQNMSATFTRGQSRLPDGIGGRDWQLEFSTQGSVQGLVIE